ncbi:phenylalanine--tRNA ligase subunit alpha [Candidatus Uabimicrobium amorphum]|uniref:Phenylalanine--tRNA ligase alpha subunit n=1 Tax=Uabimicrobium amorphum TaxID=2596890 RepID=A0A5S9IM39_UABAM|nr:phenylalanine--tRNA ligase subunit alpha [Candidatus Uabimicrobium amorphum]BBM83085.1 phenylalanine--tRNA ligase alpha subunit [Candidatus Uabimicrobium amorphum]
MSTQITNEQYKLFSLVANTDKITIKQLCEETQIEQPMVMGTMTFAEGEGWVHIEEYKRLELVPTSDAQELLANGLAERKFLTILQESNNSLAMQDVAKRAKENDLSMGDIMKWGMARGWFKKNGQNLELTDSGIEAISQEAHDERALKLAIEKQSIFLDELGNDFDAQYVEKLLRRRGELAKLKERTVRYINMTDKGKEVFPTLQVKEEGATLLTPEDLASGRWKDITLRPYDITEKADIKVPVKCHPLQKIIQETRRTFLEMGFIETVSPHLDTGLWDFDALFQPQDHPSRDMQDTFYMKKPQYGSLPNQELVERISSTHENGGNTGSSGWGYKWDSEEARRMVLRTHTTASSIRYLSENPNPPSKVFCVGRVFRNETISFKHLPEFHQVDGIVVDKNASLCSLLGTLQAFYRKMGFDKVKFKPSFFPYTEPSAEVFVWMEQKSCWIELGGSGIFRPEVTMPLGCNVPVMAWGLGLERLAMLRYGISDIRTLYGSDLDWLQEAKLCQ